MCFKAASNSSIKTQEFRVRSSSCAMPLYTLEMKVKTLLPLHHDCNLRLDIMHTLLRSIVKKLSQYLGGCWNTLCKCTCHYFKLDVLVFFFKFFFLYQTIHANPINLAKRRHVLFSSWFKCYYSLCIHCDFTHNNYETLLNWTVAGKENT